MQRLHHGHPPLDLRALLLVFAVTALGCGDPVAARPERIVLVSIDTLRADFVGAYGAARAHTPNLDALASRGVRFEVALSPAPLTLPAHASLMTGLDPPRHGVRHNSIHRLGPELPTLAERLGDAGYATAAFVGAVVLERRFGLARGFDSYDDRSEGRLSGGTGYAERRADEVVDAALEWLADAPERFFLWVHFYDPHAAYAPPPGFASAFPDAPYAGEIAFVDAELGRLLEAIRERFGHEGLLVVATSDHGEGLGDHGELTHSYMIYESTQRIPLLLEGAGLPSGKLAPGPASLVDVAPTLLAMAGAEPLPETDGRDLRELLSTDATDERAIYMETQATHLDFGWSPLQGLRVGDWKYIRAPRPELFQLRHDPGEEKSRAESEPETLTRLEALLSERLRRGSRPPLSVTLSAQQRERLRSLGYVVPEAEATHSSEPASGPDPKDQVWVLQELARAQAELEEGQGAEALERLQALNENSTTILAHRAAAALAAGELVSAERDARAVLASEPGRSDMRILLARMLYDRGDEAGAERVLAVLPEDAAPAGWVALGAARGEIAAGQPAAALRRLQRAREQHPQDADLALASSLLLQAAGRPDDAQAAREAALALIERALPTAQGEARSHLVELKAKALEPTTGP